MRYLCFQKIKNEKMKKYLPFLLGLLLIIIDQIIKWWVINNPSFLYINPGFIFGLGSNYDLFFWILMTIILILAFFVSKKEKKYYWVFCIMLSGAISNLIDRFFRGGVIDYFKIDFGYQLIFNFADVLLVTGLIIYIYQSLKQDGKH